MLKFVLSRVLLPLLVFAFAPHLPPLVAAIDQGDILRWLGRANWTFWLTFSLLFADLLALLALRNRSRIIRLDARARLARVWRAWRRSGSVPDAVEHDDVLWPVGIVPGDPPRITVSPTPLCPVCRTGLVNRPGRLFRRWQCPKCGYRKIVHHSPGEQAARLEQLALQARDAPGCPD